MIRAQGFFLRRAASVDVQVLTQTHIVRAALATNALNSQQRRWMQILEAHGRPDAKLLVEGVQSVDELVGKTELLEASTDLKDELADMNQDTGTCQTHVGGFA